MSTDIANREETGTAMVPIAAETSPLVLWAYEASRAHKIAESLAKTSFVPASMQGKPHDITAAILAGHELGLPPMAALRSMDIIQGTPALRAHAMRGLVQSKGHKVWLVEQTETRVVMKGQRLEADGSYGPEQVSRWTIERAAKLGLAGKEQWKKQPQTMLTARATGEISRLIAADVLYAMPYAAEELDDDLGPISAGRAETTKPRTARRAVLPASVPEPELQAYLPTDDPTPVDEPTGDTPPEPVFDDEWPATAQPGGPS